MTYFDWNATAPLHPEARAALLEALQDTWANPSTPYRLGVRARLALDAAREETAAILRCRPDDVVFTSGATEGNNGVLREGSRRSGPDGLLWISAVEHPSVQAAAMVWWGAERVRLIPVDTGGVVDLDWIRDHLRKERPGLVSVMAANNETGVLQPWQRVRDLCREAGVAFHSDGVQWIAKEKWESWAGCSAVTLSGHKFGGPKGVGCLLVDDAWKGLKIQAGGAQERDMRAGTENVPAILAMVAALRARHSAAVPEDRPSPRDRAAQRLQEKWPGGVRIHGAGRSRLWNTLSLSLPDFPSDRWIARLDRRGYAVSSGSACSTGKAGPSAVLKAMGIEDSVIRRTIRISSGWETPAGDWDSLVETLIEIHEALASAEPPSGPGRVIDL